ncbi:hypothetical protein [Paenibacillus sp. GCM10027626]|uniref:hypothetical protein n=1 Tax=Paenibacillus sp. GCM10027626 TaxID=3273411 RepID=UPI00363C6FFB
MSASVAQLLMWAALFSQYIIGFIVILFLLRALMERRPRFAHLLAARWRGRQCPERWLRFAFVRRESAAFQKRERLLAGCGMTWDAAWYVVLRRAAMLLIPIAASGAYAAACAASGFPLVPVLLLLVVLLIALLWDQIILNAYRKARAERMTKEIYIVSNQLLYLAGSSLHIHAKLLRCLPFTKAMRADLQMLLGEWYHDAEEALRRFKLKIGTEEGLSFAETINALRLHDSEQYYDLLRERIKDYKEKLELAKESRQESTSYILFVLAGIPILYTFQIFIYPWVREGQKLFESLH